MLKVTAAAALLVSTSLFAQEGSAPKEKKFAIKAPNMKLEPFAQVQGWGVYSFNRDSQNDSDSGLDKSAPRMNFYFRQARVGLKGKPYENLTYFVSLFYDGLGHDSQSATRGGTNPVTNSKGSSLGAGATVGVWDAFLMWKVNQSDLFYVTAGYFRPQISHASLVSPFNVNSFDKAASQGYVRRAVTGRGFGRATGINLGGLSADKKWNYNIGVFNKETTGETVGTTTYGETSGSAYSVPVYVGRLAYSFGDAEMSRYNVSNIINYFGKRKGLTVALSAASQGRTPQYKSNQVVGGDFLYNWGPWQIDGEMYYIYNKDIGSKSFSRARTGHVRAGYNFFLDNGTILEPMFMVSEYYGDTGAAYTGRDTVVDVGLNWYLDENRYKFFVHYVSQSGDGTNLENKDGTNGYHYGDYAGVGVTLQI